MMTARKTDWDGHLFRSRLELTDEQKMELAAPPSDGSAPQYVISTVGDFLKVPEDRQADCLSEFADFLSAARDIVELASIVGEIVRADAAAKIGPYTWIDDGKKNRTIRISAQNARLDQPEGAKETT